MIQKLTLFSLFILTPALVQAQSLTQFRVFAKVSEQADCRDENFEVEFIIDSYSSVRPIEARALIEIGNVARDAWLELETPVNFHTYMVHDRFLQRLAFTTSVPNERVSGYDEFRMLVKQQNQKSFLYVGNLNALYALACDELGRWAEIRTTKTALN